MNKNTQKLALIVLLINLVLNPVMWFLAFSGDARMRSDIAGYQSWYFSFASSDAWLWILSAAALWAVLSKSRAQAKLLSAVGAVCIYILIYVSSYELRNGIFLASGLKDPMQLALKFYNLFCGVFLFGLGLRG